MYKRKLFHNLFKEKNNKKISVILGSRQVGKTTLLKQLYGELCKKYNGIFLDMDLLTDYEKISSYQNALNTLKLNDYSENQTAFFYLFIDEFQRYKGFSKILKNIYDHHNNIKIYVSGSSSIKIKDEIQESLAGRKFIHYLFSLDFEEFLLFKDHKEALKQLKNVQKLEGKEIRLDLLGNLLEEFLIFGAYPEVVSTKDNKQKVQILNSIFDLYVKKDLVEFLDINKILNVKKLIELLSVNHGQKIKYEQMASTCGISEYEVKNYIELLKESFLIYELRPYFTNKNKEIVKIPKIYFLDPGVRNYFLNNFNSTVKRTDGGFLFEGFVLGELLKTEKEKLNYWQDKNKNEVDFIIDKVHEQIPVEVKFKKKLKYNDFTGLKAFASHYPKTKNFFCISPSSQNTEQVNGNCIKVLLPFDLRSHKCTN